MIVGKWTVETTRSHKHVYIPEDQILFYLTLLTMIISQLQYILFEIIEYLRLYN